uniref:FRIGIDA-like protein n=1 Tax=Setaria digitata TaxID=48799 RepID=A0A915Q570_9BILA
MVSSKHSKSLRNAYITISNPKQIEVAMQGSKRILQLDDIKFEINEQQMIAASNFLKRMLIGEDVAEKKEIIVLDVLKGKQPCFDVIGLAIAIEFANGTAKVPLERITNALAAANALEMWHMCKAISQQLCMLAAQPKSAPFAINVAVCNLEKDEAKCVIKRSLDIFDKVIKQSNFNAISYSTFELFLSLYIYEHSSTIKEHEKKAVVENAVRAVRIWCGDDYQRFKFSKNIINKLRPFCGIDIIDHIEKFIAANITKQSAKDKKEISDDSTVEHNVPRMINAAMDNSVNNPNESLKFEAFRHIELPVAEPDANGVEFEAPKELLFSDKPKLIGLQLEAILECPNH